MTTLIRRFADVSRSLLQRRAVPVAVALALQCSMAGAATLNSEHSLVGQAVDESQRVIMAGHLNPRARPEADAGMVPATMPMQQMQLIFKHDRAQERALHRLLAGQNDKDSPSYHHWLTPAQYGAQFGASDADIAVVSAWLTSKGFSVGTVPAGHAYLPFSGNAAQVQEAFQTEVHFFNAADAKHFAPTVNPSIPAALGGLVKAIGGLNDFHPKSNASPRVDSNSTHAAFTDVDGNHNLVPGDLATIYNLNALYRSGINGAGVTVVIAAQSDIDPTVPQTYWNSTGVGQNQQLFSIAVPASQGGFDPGQTYDGNETEAYLDTELVGGLAPGAQIVLVRDSNVTNAAQYAVELNIAPVLNISFGACEHDLGNDGNAQVAAIYQQAAAQGITVLVSSGDEGVATCDYSRQFTSGEAVVTGLSVNGLASTPYNVAVGGTDFNMTLPENFGPYGDPVTLASAQGYTPEDVWNTSCANPDYVTLTGAASADALCNSQTAVDYDLDELGGGGGGLSGCAFLSDSGACAGGYAQPYWQRAVYGSGNLGARALPDIALLADHFLVCDQSVACSPATGGYIGLQGTSGAAPIMAAIVALAAQVSGPQGNLNPLLYAMGTAQYGTTDSPNQDALNACNANNGAGINTGCIFNDVTQGSIAQPCEVADYIGAPLGSTPYGDCVVENSDDTFGVVQLNGADVFPAAFGFDLATGLGSLNATNFVIQTYEVEHSAQPSAAAVKLH